MIGAAQSCNLRRRLQNGLGVRANRSRFLRFSGVCCVGNQGRTPQIPSRSSNPGELALAGGFFPTEENCSLTLSRIWAALPTMVLRISSPDAGANRMAKPTPSPAPPAKLSAFRKAEFSSLRTTPRACRPTLSVVLPTKSEKSRKRSPPRSSDRSNGFFMMSSAPVELCAPSQARILDETGGATVASTPGGGR